MFIHIFNCQAYADTKNILLYNCESENVEITRTEIIEIPINDINVDVEEYEESTVS